MQRSVQGFEQSRCSMVAAESNPVRKGFDLFAFMVDTLLVKHLVFFLLGATTNRLEKGKDDEEDD
ncbi:MAG: hypothetical protein JXR96_17770 [Deltaproteobacteria bacterium]|nr:hypothetical protein [Deltaproteobacteria bacterium]